MQIVKPRTMSGFMELLPSEQLVFEKMMSKIRNTFELNGLVPLDTPVLELSEILLAKGGGDTEKQVYRFNKGDTDICMRFDLTVPLAKYVALNKNQLIFPFQRYQIGKVYRGERVQRARLREFYQCDVDIIGDGELPLIADARILHIADQLYSNLGLKAKIRVNNRKILLGIIEEFGFKKFETDVLRIFDKLDKIGISECQKEIEELTNIKNSKIYRVFDINSFDELKKFDIKNPVFVQGVSEMEEVLSILSKMNIKNKIEYDIKIIRGLDYYTGTVFEGFLEEGLQLSAGGGGRYDNLAGYYTEDKLVGVGFSIGLSRLFEILRERNLLEFNKNTNSDIAIIQLGDTLSECLKLSEKFLQNSIKNEILYLCKSFKAQMNYANKTGVPYIIVVGENEVKNQIFGLKNMKNGEVKNLTADEIVSFLKEVK